MSWKNSLPFFIWQTFRFSRNIPEFRQNWRNYPRWSKSFQPGRNSVNDESAWITFDGLDFLNRYLQAEHHVFEYGGGGSTLFFCKRVASVVTVEHHEAWFRTVEKILADKGYPHWQGFFCGAEPFSDERPRNISNPADFASNAPEYAHMSFEQYARTIDAFDDESFDLILVDGRARPSCAMQAIPKLKTGGLLIFDNSERPYYLPALREIFARQFTVELDTYAPVPYSPDFSTTLILKKR